jgi:DNA excision repair protein ERCC-1
MGHMYTLRIMLVMCDVDDSQSAIKELVKVALVNSLTLMVAWTAEEAGSYIERYKAFEHKAPDLIRERVNNDYMSHLNSALTSIKGVNKTDVMTLATNFGVGNVLQESTERECVCLPTYYSSPSRG